VVDCPSKEEVRFTGDSQTVRLLRIRKAACEQDATDKLKLIEEQLREHGEKLDTATTFDSKYGKLFATSGLKTVSGYIQDWGLAVLDEARFSDFDGLSSVCLALPDPSVLVRAF
jgi:hypothetical protein